VANKVNVYNYDSKGRITAKGTMDTEVFEVVPLDATIIQPPKEEKDLEPDERLRFDEANDKWILEKDPEYTEPIVNNEPTDRERIEDLESFAVNNSLESKEKIIARVIKKELKDNPSKKLDEVFERDYSDLTQTEKDNIGLKVNE